MEPLCEYSNLTPVKEECFEQAVVYIFLYGLTWQIVMYGVCWPAAEASKHTTGVSQSERSSCGKVICNMLKKSLLNPPVIGLILGTIVAIVRPLHGLLFSSTALLAPIASTVTLFGQGTVPLSCFVVAGLFVEPLIQGLTAVKSTCCKSKAANDTNKSVDTDIDVELTNISKTAVGDDVDADSDSEANTTGATTNSVKVDVESLEEVKSEDWKFTVGLVLVRLVISPIASFTMAYCVDLLGWDWMLPRDDKLFRFIVLIEAGMPSAQTAAIMMKQLGLDRAAYKLSGGYIAQYTFSTITMTLLVIAAQQYVTTSTI